MTTPRLPHGRTLLHRVLETGLLGHLEQLGFTRHTYEFHRPRGVLTEVITLSVRTERRPPGQRVFWVIASLAATPPRARFEVDYRQWLLEPGFDAADFAVGLTEHLHQHGLPALAAHGPEDTARGLERWYADDQAVLLWRTLGREDEAARVVAEWQPPAPGDDEAPF
ncbi:MAG: hypothetical protein Q8L14_33470 [Myxococcales bacterium]|nr:hypothetical protein [Myxococcales bacterium]